MTRPARFNRRTLLQQGLAGMLCGPACLYGPAPALAWNADEPFDLLITGGNLIDGTGAKRQAADIGIRAGKITAIGQLANRPARRTLTATGKIVSPGFIDMHAHSDRTLLRDGLAHSAVRQGATTHVIGNCGSSPAPRQAGQADDSSKFSGYGEFLQALVESGISLNVAGLVGHNQVRAQAMGYENRRPSEAELARMCDHVEEAMRGGAVGMSTGLVSPPGTYSETPEIIELAKVVARHGGLYASHIRGEAGSLIPAVQEAIEIGRAAQVPVEISHHKAAGRENWGKTRITLLAIEQANQRGQTVRVDVYPYRAGSAGLSQLVPPWAHEGGSDQLLARLRNPETRRRIAQHMTAGTDGWANFYQVDWDAIQITRADSPANRKWVGKKVGDVARDRGCSGVDACIDLLIEESGNVGMINFIMDEEEMRRVLVHPLSMIGSDGTAVSPDWYQGQPHPRFYGCFPRILGRYVREEQLLTLEQAIHKMTGMPAEQLDLPDRGQLKIGRAADIVVFDPHTIIDRATFDDPHQFPAGIERVIVNGALVVDQGKHLETRPGKVVSPQRG